MKEKIVKYICITFIVGFFIYLTIVCLKDCDKPTTGHYHDTKPEDEHKHYYVG